MRNGLKTVKEKSELPTVHFHKQLVEGVLSLTLITKVPCASFSADRINLINKKNARDIFSSCGE